MYRFLVLVVALVVTAGCATLNVGDRLEPLTIDQTEDAQQQADQAASDFAIQTRLMRVEGVFAEVMADYQARYPDAVVDWSTKHLGHRNDRTEMYIAFEFESGGARYAVENIYDLSFNVKSESCDPV